MKALHLGAVALAVLLEDVDIKPADGDVAVVAQG